MDTTELDQEYLKSLTVLYVEDEADTREQFTQFLKRHTGELIIATNGEEGLWAYRHYNPAIIISDINMPVMDGLTMAAKIRHRNAEIPIIVLTAFEHTDYLLKAINIGIDKYVTKPVDGLLLHKALLECAHRLMAEEKLAEQQKFEQEALRLKHAEASGIFAGGLAHDFNNLLQAILGTVFVAKMHLKPEDNVYKYLENTEQYFSVATELSQRLMLLAKSSVSNLQAWPVSMLVLPAVEDVCVHSSIIRTCNLPEDLPPVMCDPHQVSMLFRYLVENAREAMPENGTLSLSGCMVSQHEGTKGLLKPGDYILISLQDNGHGIAADILPKIFDPYFSTKPVGSIKGTGLSLAICQTIVNRHHGLITAESSIGEGATFHIYLPVAR